MSNSLGVTGMEIKSYGDPKKKWKAGCLTCWSLFGACACCLAFAVVFVVLTVVICGAIWTNWNVGMVQQQYFEAGSQPVNGSISGFYYGTPVGFVLTTSAKIIPWKGKSFVLSNSTGVNYIDGGDNTRIAQFPFRTWYGNGILDPKVKVFKIDYDIAENPSWLRGILDELVMIKPGFYIGKMQYIVSPGNVWTLGYFELKN